MRLILPATALLTFSFVSTCTAQSGPSLPKLPQVDFTYVDSSISPCSDFYQYVCGKRNAADPIPPDLSWWGPFEELEDWNRQVLRQILERNAIPNHNRTLNEQKIGDFYASCMNQPSKGELSVLRPILDRISAMKDKREIATTLALLHSSFGRAWEATDNQTNVALIGYGPGADYNDVSRVVAGVDQAGLGLPGRDFYLKNDDDSQKIRKQYLAFIVALMMLGGESDAEANRDATTVVRIETLMAHAQMDNVTRRDPSKVNNRYTPAQLKELTPAFDWDAYLRGMNAPAVPLYEVSAPEYFRALNKLLLDEDLATWKVYLRFHAFKSVADFMGKDWRDASFGLERELTGVKQQQPDWRRCTLAVDHYMGEALGQVYVDQVFPADSKARALKMIKDIETAMGQDMDSISWMQPSTKREAHLKLAALIEKIGYPDKWIDYSSLSISRDSFLTNVEHASAFELRRQLAFIGHPLDRQQWFMTPPTTDAYEDSQTNTINFPAGMLQPPFFDARMDDVVNYGAEGVIMGHELTHDFDDQGRKFDAKGNLRDWWTSEDQKQYEERGSCVVEEYTGPVPSLPGIVKDGKLTQGEDTADNGGIYLALAALSADLRRQGKSLDDKDSNGLTNLQRFFISFATGTCDQIRPEALRTLVLTNPHSAPWLRVNNVVGNMPEFQKAFGCKSGDPEVHATRCRVW